MNTRILEQTNIQADMDSQENIFIIKVLCTFFFLIYLFSSCSTDTQVDEKSSFYYYSLGKKKIIYREVKDTGGFFPIPTGIDRFELEDADPKTFEVLDKIIAKDANNVYRRGGKLDNVDAPTFEVLESNLYKDKNNVYKAHMGILNIWEEVDAPSFELIDASSISWARDKNGYLYYYKRVNVDYETFEVVDNRVAYDKDSLYDFQERKSYLWQGKFRRLTVYTFADEKQIIMYNKGLNYYPIKDHNSIHVYDSINRVFEFDGDVYWGNAICNIKPDKESYISLGPKHGKDKNYVYFEGEIISNANSAHFELLEEGSYLGKDDRYVFDREKIIPEVDPNTVVYERREYKPNILRDKNNQWIKKRGWEKVIK